MRKTTAIFAKEVKNYFYSPIAYVVMTGFAVLSGISFYNRAVNFPQYINAAYQSGQLETIKQNRINFFLVGPMLLDIAFIMMFLVPVLTMRLFAEEKRMRTDELLLTSPVTVNQIVGAKYLAGLFFSLLVVLLTFIHIGVLYYYGASPDPGMTFTSCLALALFVASIVSVGVFTSSLTENQIVASVSCLIVELLFSTFQVAARSISNPYLSKILAYLSPQSHMKNLMDGVLITDDLLYFASFIFLFLFLTNRSIESSRWR